jgi:hypothetical protein
MAYLTKSLRQRIRTDSINFSDKKRKQKSEKEKGNKGKIKRTGFMRTGAKDLSEKKKHSKEKCQHKSDHYSNEPCKKGAAQRQGNEA